MGAAQLHFEGHMSTVVNMPQDYQLVKNMSDDPDFCQTYMKRTADCLGLVQLFPIPRQASMEFGDKQVVIDRIHRSLAENQALIEVGSGERVGDFHYIYSIIKTHKELSGVQYHMMLDVIYGDAVLRVNAFFDEIGSTGIRDVNVLNILCYEGNISIDDKVKMSSWQQDPYDKNLVRPYLMNLSEKREYDAMFPDHPLSQCRALLQYIQQNEESKMNVHQGSLNHYRKHERLLAFDKQDGTYERRVIKAFIKQKLDGNINKLADFDFSTLEGDTTFGEKEGVCFSYYRNVIVQSIMSVAFGDLWPGLNMFTIENYTYNVTPVNDMRYLFGGNILDEYFMSMQKFCPSKEQHERAVKVSHLLRTIGNLWILPKHIDNDKETYHYHGCTDLFLKAVYSVMTGMGKVDPSLKGQLYGARKEMTHLQGAEGFEKMVGGLFLDDFLDYYGKPTDVLPQVWFLMKGLNREAYFKAVDDYCTFMEQFVPKRSKLIVEKLKKALAQENLANKYFIEQIMEEERTNEFSKVGYAFKNAMSNFTIDGDYQGFQNYISKTLTALSFGYDKDNTSRMDPPAEDKRSSTNQASDNNCGRDIYTMHVGRCLLLRHIRVKRTSLSVWQAFLLGVVSFTLPLFNYVHRTYIFSHKDFEWFPELANKKAPLYGIRDEVSPKVKIRGSEGSIECCFWDERRGLIRETLRITCANETVHSIKLAKEEMLYSISGLC